MDDGGGDAEEIGEEVAEVQVKTVLCGVWLAVPPRATVPRVGPRPRAPRRFRFCFRLPLPCGLDTLTDRSHRKKRHKAQQNCATANALRGR